MDPDGPDANLPTANLEKASESGTARLWSEGFRIIGGLAAVALGVIVVLGIAIGGFIVGTDTAAAIAGSTAGVVGSIVGAYFGVKVGTDQTKTALQAGTDQTKAALDSAQKESAKKDQHAAKAQVYALHVPPEAAALVETEAQRAAHAVGQT